LRVTLESTSRVVDVVGPGGGVVPGRVWEGHSGSGVRVFAVITRLAADRGLDGSADLGEFESELARCADPSPESFQAIPARLVL
jgi:hypothetical protein